MWSKTETAGRTVGCPQPTYLTGCLLLPIGRRLRIGRGAKLMECASWRTSPGPWTSNCCLRNKYLVAENRILKAQFQGRLRLSDAEVRGSARLAIDWAARL